MAVLTYKVLLMVFIFQQEELGPQTVSDSTRDGISIIEPSLREREREYAVVPPLVTTL